MWKNIICAADFMRKKKMLLEALRKDLYKYMPVRKNWHKKYAKGKVNTDNYWDQGKKLYGNY